MRVVRTAGCELRTGVGAVRIGFTIFQNALPHYDLSNADKKRGS